MPTLAVMNFFVIVIVLISAQENHGLTGSGVKDPVVANNSTHDDQKPESNKKENTGRNKRYIDHFNLLSGQQDFLKKDGKLMSSGFIGDLAFSAFFAAKKSFSMTTFESLQFSRVSPNPKW